MLHAWMGLGGITLLIVAVILSIFSAKKRAFPVRLLLCAFALTIAWLPYEDLYVVEYLRALSGDLSITLMFILALTIVSHFRAVPILTQSSATSVFLFALAASLVLYPMELGLTSLTPYTLGYGSNLFFAFLFLATLSAWFFGRYLLAGCITLACAAYTLGLLESPNLWDYLIDPVIVFFTPFWLIGHALARLFCTQKAPTRPMAARVDASDLERVPNETA